MKLPVIILGWTSHLKKYVPGVEGAIKVYVVVVTPVIIAPLKMVVVAADVVYAAKL